MNGARKYILYIILVTALGGWVRAGIILLYPFDPLTIHDIVIVDADNTVLAGDSILLNVHYTKNTDLPAVVTRRLIGPVVIALPPTTGTNPIGAGIARVQVLVPSYADSGDYHIATEYTYTYGSFPARKIVVYSKTPMFHVINPRSAIDSAIIEKSGINREDIKTNTDAIDALQKSIKKTDEKANRYDTRGK